MLSVEPTVSLERDVPQRIHGTITKHTAIITFFAHFSTQLSDTHPNGRVNGYEARKEASCWAGDGSGKRTSIETQHNFSISSSSPVIASMFCFFLDIFPINVLWY
jgi:hypothetical protein